MIVSYVLLAIAGFASGYINVMAGAGSLLTLPALIFVGLDAGAANATNRIGVIVQSLAAVATFRKGGLKVPKLAWQLAVPATATALAGAWAATLLSDQALRISMAIAMFVFAGLSFVRAGKRHEAKTAEATARAQPLLAPTLGMWLAFASIGFYAGFLQAGVGIPILLYLSLVHGVTLVHANAIKIVVILIVTVGAFAVFLLRAQTIDWTAGAILSAATALGAWLGARAALERGERFVRIVLVLAVSAGAIKVGWDAL